MMIISKEQLGGKPIKIKDIRSWKTRQKLKNELTWVNKQHTQKVK